MVAQPPAVVLELLRLKDDVLLLTELLPVPVGDFELVKVKYRLDARKAVLNGENGV